MPEAIGETKGEASEHTTINNYKLFETIMFILFMSICPGIALYELFKPDSNSDITNEIKIFAIVNMFFSIILIVFYNYIVDNTHSNIFKNIYKFFYIINLLITCSLTIYFSKNNIDNQILKILYSLNSILFLAFTIKLL